MSPEEHGIATNNAVSLRRASAIDGDLIAAAIQLGNQSRRTLGHLPFAVYEEAAARGWLVIAECDGHAVGYALFGVTRTFVRLTHLCVDSAYRRQGIARRLVEWISTRHADRQGILVSCRRDYRLGQVWSALGFEALSERRGRGRRGGLLVAWWRDHGHPQLFARPSESVLVRASVDLNVLRDLAQEGRTDREESLALLSDQIADRLEVVRTPALDVEMDALEDDGLRATCLNTAQGMRAAHPDRDRFSRVHAEVAAAADEVDPTFRATAQGRLDVQYVSEAIAADLNVFVTRDQRLTDVLRLASAKRGVKILRPAETVVRIDELVRVEAYRPAALQATDFRRQLIPAGHDGLLESLVNAALGERRGSFRQRIRALTVEGYERIGIFAPDNALVAALATRTAGRLLEVPLLRILDGPLADTLARHLLFMLRHEARVVGATVIRLSDRSMARAVVAAAIDDGFLPFDDGHHAFVIDVCGRASDVHHAAVVAARDRALPAPPNVRSGLAGAAAAEIERAWWPAKVTDSTLATYLVPIRQAFSSQLLGVPHGLFSRPAELGLSRELVYYRSPRGPKPTAPARILWYMSGSGRGSPAAAAVIGASLLDEIVEATPAELDSQYRHLGVWRLDQIEDASSGGTAQALRFINTELFQAPIPLRRLREVVGTPPQAPRRIASAAFTTLYREGRGA